MTALCSMSIAEELTLSFRLIVKSRNLNVFSSKISLRLRIGVIL